MKRKGNCITVILLMAAALTVLYVAGIGNVSWTAVVSAWCAPVILIFLLVFMQVIFGNVRR